MGVVKFSFILTLLVLMGCTTFPAAVDDRSPPESNRIETHQVESGETLYSIAWRYDLTIQHLAAINQLSSPYTISPGDLLKLVDNGSVLSGSKGFTTYRVAAGDTLFSIAKNHGTDVIALARWNKLSSPYLIHKGQILRIAGTKNASEHSPTGERSDTGQPVTFGNKQTIKKSVRVQPYSVNWVWKWPVKGKVLESFNPKKLHKGIKIQSNKAKQVHAAAPGNVVYAGSGLRGYGRLIIIKHSDTLLSAYANNDNLFVNVGDRVTQKEAIASLGSDSVLYFEIRKDGNPVNPLNYLK